MRNRIFKWFGLVIIAGLGFVFMRCENGFTETQPVDELTLTLRDDNALETNLDNFTAEELAEYCSCLLQDVQTQDLSDKEIEALLFMREEEKLARDIYLTLKETWTMPIFTNISAAEQRHMDAMLCLINRYPDKVTDPVGDRPLGDFAEADLLALFTQFYDNQPTTLTGALTVGAEVEDRDIKDLMMYLADEVEVNNEDIRMVLSALLRASHNHLRAFTTLLANLDEPYTPQALTVEEFETIVGTTWERGGLTCLTCPVCQGTCDGTCPGCDGVCPVCDGVCKAECPYDGPGPFGDGICDGTCPGCDGVCPGTCINNECPQFRNKCCIGKCGRVIAACNRNKMKFKYRNMNNNRNKNSKKGKK